jgi:hypothetical protein
MEAVLLQRDNGITSGRESGSEGSNDGRNKVFVKHKVSGKNCGALLLTTFPLMPGAANEPLTIMRPASAVAATLFFHQDGEPRCSFWRASPISF